MSTDRLVQVVDSVSGTITRSYDGLNRLTLEVTPQGSVSYAYDAASRRTSMSVSGQTAVTYGFDNANRLTQISQGSANVSFGYDNDSRRTSLTLPNGIVLGYGYDAASQPTGITYTLGSNTLGNLPYAYDLAGRRLGVGGSFARTGAPPTAPLASYNVNNQLTQWKGATLTYDANGNLTGDGTNTYTWNPRNQLASISGGASASFQYDPFGRRVSKTIGGITQYLYDGANPVQEISGTTASANLLTGGVDEYFQRTDAVAGARNFLTDALGSTLALADSTGTLQTQYTFEPFGNTSVTGSTTTNSFAFTGRELDATGLYFYRARYYSPSFHRFASEDPLTFLGGGSNLYTYTFNNPLSYQDPSGRCPLCIVALITGAAGGALAGYKAYTCGARGWDLAAAIAGGTGTGILAGLTGGAVGFAVADAAAPVVGYGLLGSVIGGSAPTFRAGGRHHRNLYIPPSSSE
jgi:RHS repeat-associated protein